MLSRTKVAATPTQRGVAFLPSATSRAAPVTAATATLIPVAAATAPATPTSTPTTMPKQSILAPTEAPAAKMEPAAPAGKSVPRMGIGKVWRENYYKVQSYPRLDFALGPEKPLTALRQRFENGTILRRNDNGHFYVLFTNFSYPGRSGFITDKVWFDVAP